jgi:hypothetical protein
VNKILYSLFFFIIPPFHLFAQENYSLDQIPKDVLNNSNVVVRMRDENFEILDSSKAVYKVKYAYTILNSAGDRWAQLVRFYFKFIGIDNISGTLYDATGKKIKSLKKSEISDESGSDGYSLMEDFRVKIHNFNWKLYPYTIEYEVTEQRNGLLFLPHWDPVSTEKISVQKSSFTVLCPSKYKLRYKTLNLAQGPVIEDKGAKKSYSWTLENFKAIENEVYSPDEQEILPNVLIAPSSFSMQNYSGQMSDWKSFGSFYYALNKGRDILPENIKMKVHQLTENLNTVQDKVKALYEFMQKNTRYVSIQLGIGGWQTFDASYVSNKGYGDCKALSNYMMSLLKEAGIASNVVIIRGGEGEGNIVADFTSNQFNHVILCVPQKKDSIWLECTSQTQPFGYLGGFTSDRYGLLVDENNSKLIHTPIYKKTDNSQIRKIVAKVDSEGHLDAQIFTRFKAEQQDDLSGRINAYSREKVEEYLKEAINLPSYDLTSFKYEEVKNMIPELRESLEIKANNFASVTGKRIFISPNILNRSNARIPNPETRKFGFFFVTSWLDIDSVEMDIPKGYTPESIPKDLDLSTKFGYYNANLIVKPGKIIYIRKSSRNNGTYPSKDALALADYFDQIYKADRRKLVLVKNE